MKNSTQIYFLSVGLLFCCLMASAQKTVESIKADKIVITDKNNNVYEWQLSSLTDNQVKTLLSTGTNTILSAQDELTFEQLQVILDAKPNILGPSKMNSTANNGLHLEIEAGLSPISTYGVEETSFDSANKITEKSKLESQYTFGLNAALVYQINRTVFVGAGTGLRKLKLQWTTYNESNSYDTYALPLFIRGGLCDPISSKVCLLMNFDLGVQIGMGDKQKTAFIFNPQLGIYYGTTKIALGMLGTKPDSGYFFGENVNNSYEVGLALVLGFRI